MKKLNKKGFTLVEMLVVIAIIAVLVAVIVPTVSTATTKAAAATNAANLRSIQAEATIDYLGGVANSDGFLTYAPGTNGAAGTFTANASAPVSKQCGSIYAGGDTVTALIDANNQITVYYGSTTNNITYFSTIAETGAAPTSSSSAS